MQLSDPEGDIMRLWETLIEMIGAGEGEVLVGVTLEEGIFVVAGLTEEVQTGQCIKQFAVIVEKNARYLLGQQTASPFFVANVLKKEVEKPDMITSRTGVQEGQVLRVWANSLSSKTNLIC